ncbi:MAG TPA: MauE/DoxX family redox-associated membrane protein [Sphingobacteriaceae bacterium]|nr:MauE/DoxX family redox-associated membrane protein [Sphingobacteriaceae bacterium]
MKKLSLYLMVVLYIAAGLNHFIHPEFYRNIMPSWVPFHEEMIIISGICEILFAVLLLFPLTRRIGAWCIIALLIAVFPANIHMMLNDAHNNIPRLWISLLRLPVQAILIWWAYSFTSKLPKNVTSSLLHRAVKNS